MRTSTVVIALPPIENQAQPVRIIDTRPLESKVERTSKDESPSVYLGDTSFVPSPVKVIELHTANGLPKQYSDATVELTRFDVGLVTRGGYLSGVSPVSPVPGVSPGAYVLGNLLGALVIAGARAASGYGPRTSAYADVAIRIDGLEYSGVEFVELRDGQSAENALAKAVTGAIQFLLYDVGTRSPALSPQ